MPSAEGRGVSKSVVNCTTIIKSLTKEAPDKNFDDNQ